MAYKKSKETYNHIMDVTIELFYTKGFKETKIREICRQANINHSLIYYYFPDGKYDIAYKLITVHEKKCSQALRKHFKTTNYILYTLVWLRFLAREMLQNEIDMVCYVEAWSFSRPYRNLFIENFTAAKQIALEVDAHTVQIATLMGDSVWSGLYQSKFDGKMNISHKEIRDATDIARWTYMGLSLDKIKSYIKEAEKILETIPIQHTHLLVSKNEKE